MRRIFALSAALAVACAPSGAKENSSALGATQSKSPESPAKKGALDRVTLHMPKGNVTQARDDANAAARDREFGLISTGDARFYSTPAGVICFTPNMQAPLTLTSFRHGDFITPDVSAQLNYAGAYNRALAERSDYPYRDLCRVRTNEDRLRPYDPSVVTRPANTVTEPPRDLFEAARRGSGRDVRAFLNPISLNAVDGVGMTALAWAVARNNRPALDLFISARANPWQTARNSGYGDNATAVYWAAALGRNDFRRLMDLRARPFESWPSSYVTAALSGENLAILQSMLAEPHDPVRLEMLRTPLPTAQALELVLKQQSDLAKPLLFSALDYSDDRPDLVRLALAHGADPNAMESYETPLAKASKGLAKSSVGVVDMLLKAGADPNLMSHRIRPVWVAVGILNLDRDRNEIDDRAIAIFQRLTAAGANLNLPDWQGRPPIWTLLFPYTFNHSKLDASFVTPELLEMLVRNGLNLNADWQGKHVLNSVEA